MQAAMPGDVLAGNSHTLPVDVNKGGTSDNVGVDREAIELAQIPKPHFGHSGNEVDGRIIEAQKAIQGRDITAALSKVKEAVRLLREVDFDELDSSGFPVADMINQTEVAIWVLGQLESTGATDTEMLELLKQLRLGINGLELKKALGYTTVEGRLSAVLDGSAKQSEETDRLRFKAPFEQVRRVLQNQHPKEFITKVLIFNYGQFGIKSEFVTTLIKAIEDFRGDTFTEFQRYLKNRGINFDTGDFKNGYAAYKKTDKHVVTLKMIENDIPDEGIFIDIWAGDEQFVNLVSRTFHNIECVYAYETPEVRQPDYEKLEANVKWIQGVSVKGEDGELRGFRIPLPDKSVTTVFIQSVLHHISPEGLSFFFEEVIRILRPEGRLIIIEDSYPESAASRDIPDYQSMINLELTREYLNLTPTERQLFLEYIDFHGNVIVGGRQDIDFFFNFKSMESWVSFIQHLGFKVLLDSIRFTGFIKGRFHQPPLGIMVFNCLTSTTTTVTTEMPNPNAPGGVDFRALPIVTQPPNTPKINMPLSGLDNFRSDPEWKEIQNMVNAGIIPSGQRIKDYLQSCCQKKGLNGEVARVLSCIADIMRIEEERVLATDQDIKSLLVLVESGKSEDELVSALNRINFSPKEPELVTP